MWTQALVAGDPERILWGSEGLHPGLLTQALKFDSVNSLQFEGSETKEIVLRPGTPKEKKLSCQAQLSNGLPQFPFHVTTVYALWRHNGLSIGKRDFTGGVLGFWQFKMNLRTRSFGGLTVEARPRGDLFTHGPARGFRGPPN